MLAVHDIYPVYIYPGNVNFQARTCSIMVNQVYHVTIKSKLNESWNLTSK